MFTNRSVFHGYCKTCLRACRWQQVQMRAPDLLLNISQAHVRSQRVSYLPLCACWHSECVPRRCRMC